MLLVAVLLRLLNPCVEVPKQIVLTASDIAIHDDLEDHFGRDLFHKGLLEILRWV